MWIVLTLATPALGSIEGVDEECGPVAGVADHTYKFPSLVTACVWA